MAAISLPAQIVRTRRSGTPGRGPDWEREVHGDIFGPVLADQVTAVQEAARLGHPGEFPHAYQACSLLAEAPKLTRPLLMHGLADDNVFPVSTLRLSSALLAAGRPHEVLLLAGVGHHAIGTPVTEHLLQHQVRFLQRHLGAVPGDL